MTYLKYTCFILCFFVSVLFATDLERLDQASSFYKNNQYDDALLIYESLHKAFPNNIDIMYNLGNVHFKLKHHGYAIAYYLKALKWNPSDSDIRYNLSLARSLVDHKSESSTSIIATIINWLRLLSINASFNIMMLCLLTFLFVLRLLQLKKFNREFLSNMLVISGLFFIISFSIFSYQYSHYSEKKGVVIAKKSAVYSGPSETLSVLFYIHEGYEFTINKITGDWLEIELSNGFKGWAPSSSLFIL